MKPESKKPLPNPYDIQFCWDIHIKRYQYIIECILLMISRLIDFCCDELGYWVLISTLITACFSEKRLPMLYAGGAAIYLFVFVIGPFIKYDSPYSVWRKMIHAFPMLAPKNFKLNCKVSVIKDSISGYALILTYNYNTKEEERHQYYLKEIFRKSGNYVLYAAVADNIERTKKMGVFFVNTPIDMANEWGVSVRVDYIPYVHGILIHSNEDKLENCITDQDFPFIKHIKKFIYKR